MVVHGGSNPLGFACFPSVGSLRLPLTVHCPLQTCIYVYTYKRHIDYSAYLLNSYLRQVKSSCQQHHIDVEFACVEFIDNEGAFVVTDRRLKKKNPLGCICAHVIIFISLTHNITRQKKQKQSWWNPKSILDWAIWWYCHALCLAHKRESAHNKEQEMWKVSELPCSTSTLTVKQSRAADK